jgi:membrane-associated phospholipid phosphatase
MKFAPLHTSSHARAATAFALVFVASLCASAQTASHATDEHATSEPTVSQPANASLPTMQPANSSPDTTQPAGEMPTASPTPQPQATKTTRKSPSLEREFVRNVLRDQRAIWTSPFHLSRGDSRWLLPLGLSAATLVATDRYTAGALDNDDHLNISHDVSSIGSIYSVGGVAAGFYLTGLVAHNARARETGLLGAEALIDGTIVSLSFKELSQRPRPFIDHASGEFFDRGNSFPSGHSMAAWSLATIVAQEYSHRRLVKITAYGLATAVAASRYTGRNHFLSDVLVGSALGYGVGRYVYHTHHDVSLDAGGTEAKERSRLLPRIAPEYDRREREYGVALAWSF